jgi:hypothetical protein
MTTREGPYTSEWIKSNEEKETKILWLKGKVENSLVYIHYNTKYHKFVNFLKLVYTHYNTKYHKFVNFLKLLWMQTISNEKMKHNLEENVIKKN